MATGRRTSRIISSITDTETAHLAATALRETWPEGKRLLFLGPWCRESGDRSTPPDATFIADPWPTPDSRRDAYAQSLDLFERLLPAVCDSLNVLHGTAHSRRFWRILTGYWLIRYIQILKDRHERLRLAVGSHPDLTTATLDPRDRIIPADTLSFFHLAVGDAYNLQLASALIDKMKIPARPLRHGGLADALASPMSARPRLKARIGSLMERALSASGAPVLLYSAVDKDDALALTLESRFSARLFHIPQFDEARALPTAERQNTLSLDFEPRDGFEALVAGCMPNDVPTCFVEFFPQLLHSAHAALSTTPKAIVSTNGWTSDETFKVVAALAAERGTRLVAVQHGGGYGLYGRTWQEYLERSCVDAYWCWGWASLDGDRRLKNVPAPLLSMPPDDGSQGTGLLFLANTQPRYPYGFHSQALGEHAVEGIRDELSFFGGLTADIRKESSVRVVKGDDTWGWNVGARIREGFPEIGLEIAKSPLQERLRRSALTVIDHPATTFLEALALNRPTILFWRPEIWDCRPSVRPLLDGLRRAGVLCDGPEAAARTVLQAWPDPRGWWSRPEVRDAVHAFQDSLALGSPRWRHRWSEELISEARA